MAELLVEVSITDTTVDESGCGGDVVYLLLLGIRVDLLQIRCRGHLLLLSLRLSCCLDLLLLLVELHFQLLLLLLEELQVGGLGLIDLRCGLLLLLI